MYFFGDFVDCGGDARPSAMRNRMRCPKPPRGRCSPPRGANLMASLCEVVRSLPPGVTKPWLGLGMAPVEGEPAAGRSSRSQAESSDATAILMLVIVVAHETPITFEEIERWLPSWAGRRRPSLGELLESDLLVLHALTPHDAARFSASAEGRAVALHEAVHLQLSIG